MLAVLVTAASSSSSAEKIDACGQAGKQSWLCGVTYDITGSERGAEIADYFATPLRILWIVLIAYVTVRCLRLLVGRVVKRLAAEGATDRIDNLRRRTGLALLDTGPVPGLRRRLRAETIGAVLRSVVSLLVWSTAVVMVLHEVGVNLTPLFAGAGILGVAIGFGSQALVRDFLSGLFMILEDQYGVGDVIDVGEATGTVEGVSLRTTRLRDVEGTVWHVPNGEIRRVGNKSQQWSRAVLDVALAPSTDVDEATALIEQVAAELCADEHFAPVILDAPEVWGVEAVDPDRVTIRLVVKTKPLEQWRVSRALRARIKKALDAAGYDLPVPQQLTVFATPGSKTASGGGPGDPTTDH